MAILFQFASSIIARLARCASTREMSSPYFVVVERDRVLDLDRGIEGVGRRRFFEVCDVDDGW